MPRNARVVLENVCYHVVTRGNNSQDVFRDNKDRNIYLRLLRRYKSKYGFKLYAFCLMKNHVHLIVDPCNPVELAKIMQGVNQSYAIYFNHRYRKNGHLWQGRFRSMIIAKDSYLMTCLNYVEANPVRAQIVKYPQEYLWSSHKYRVKGRPTKLMDSLDVI